jgi:GAF domain-containing protein/nitrogen-specific signal transduction histidine kinase
MTAPNNTTTDLQALIATLRAERDAALSEKAALARALANRDSEYGERVDHQSATVDVLKAMSASPGDPQPVFDLIVQRAQELCNSKAAGIYEYDGELVHIRADYGARDLVGAASYLAAFPMKPIRGSIACRAILDKEVIHIRDARAEPNLLPIVQDLGIRSALAIPLLRSEAVIGAFIINSIKAGGFSDTQVELLKTFAEQAAIAITSAETYRALQTRTENLQESLRYQTAISDVLNVISRSAVVLQPILDKLVETAAGLCEAEMAMINRRDDKVTWVAANYGYPPELWAHWLAQGPTPLSPGSAAVGMRTMVEGRVVHVHDVAADPGYPAPHIALGGLRTILGVPLRRGDEVIGNLGLARQRVEPFTERQIALLEDFAAQAVIAIENAQLLNEQREALEQQTATAEVLQVINSSPGNLGPVFDAMLEKSIRLCEAELGTLRTWDGERFHLGAAHGDPQLIEWTRRQRPFVPTGDGPLARIVRGDEIVHLTEDLLAANQTSSGFWEMAAAMRYRSGIAVALRKDTTLLGAISVYRKNEARPFTDKQIALLQNFAAQAVIAMENARLLNEQREALEQETATAEVLQVINANPGNLAPVFDTILEKAHTLCDAILGSLVLYDGNMFRAAATHGHPEEYAAVVRQPQPPTKRTQPLIDGERFVHALDMKADEEEPDHPVARTRLGRTDIRTALWMPLRKDGSLLGFISAYRNRVQAFTDKQIALLENFATQAVIAMDNARLLNEQREALEQQTATAEVLRVINTNPGELAPVFDVLLEKALTLCGSAFGALHILHDQLLHVVASHGLPDALKSFYRQPILPTPGMTVYRTVLGEDIVHVADLADDEAFRSRLPTRVALVDLGGARTQLIVALRKDEKLVGVIMVFRREVRPYSDNEISLLRAFADQAVIAMENARLLNEVRQRQEELRITFENMGDGVALFDETRHLVASNQRFQDMLDVPDDVIASRPIFSDYIRYLADHGEYGPDPEDHVQQLLALGSQRRAFERTRPNGRIIEIRVNPVPGGGFVVIYSDITERKRSEAEIRAARDAAEEASRTIEAAYRDLKAAQANLIQAEKMASLGQLTAGIAHEIKNPLNFVNNFAALSVDLLGELKEAAAPGLAALSERQRAEVDDVSAMLTSNLEKISEHGRRADGIVKAMLEHSRGSSGERRMVDLNALVDEALNLAYHGARAQDQTFDVVLKRNFDPGTAPVEVNPQDMTRVFLNLFANGFYAVTRRARAEADAGYVPTLKVTTRGIGDAVEVGVRDNGIGIPEEVKDKLFQPFFTTKPTGEGTGLGLSISYDIVTQQHGGSIAVDSKVGEYSEFTIRLPRRP